MPYSLVADRASYKNQTSECGCDFYRCFWSCLIPLGFLLGLCIFIPYLLRHADIKGRCEVSEVQWSRARTGGECRAFRGRKRKKMDARRMRRTNRASLVI